MRARSGLPALATFFLLSACGDRGTTTQATAPGTQPTVPTVVATPAPTAGATPTAAMSACDRIGAGEATASCDVDKRGLKLAAKLDTAISAVIQGQPKLFDLQDQVVAGSPRVLDSAKFVDALVDQLGAQGVCAQKWPDGLGVKVKDSNDQSETYQVILTSGYVWRGLGGYVETCWPASFPVNAVDAMAYVRVSAWGYGCTPGVKAPPNGTSAALPTECTAQVTATPKDALHRDIPREVHGTEIDWKIEEGEGVVYFEQWPNNNFNIRLVPIKPGPYLISATVLGLKGYFNGVVIEVPVP